MIDLRNEYSLESFLIISILLQNVIAKIFERFFHIYIYIYLERERGNVRNDTFNGTFSRTFSIIRIASITMIQKYKKKRNKNMEKLVLFYYLQ